MRTIMPVYGTRPEAIKMAPIVRAFESSPNWTCSVSVTGQHREMLDQVNSLFGIVPDHDLNIIRPGQSLNEIFARCLSGLDRLLSDVRPDAVIVQGDTTTSTAAAVAAFNVQIPVIHAEAGLRSGNILSPFPEEANRKLTSQIARLHLAPTAASRGNLMVEGIPASDIVVTGNTVIDALLQSSQDSSPFEDQRLNDWTNSDGKLLLVTTHRRESHGNIMKGIGRALSRLARMHSDLKIVIPLHRNPVVREAVMAEVEGLPNVLLTEPLPYGEFTKLMARSYLILTDSGGVQEEAPSLGIPVLVIRDNTERPEAVTAGTVKLIGTQEDVIVAETSNLLMNNLDYSKMAQAVNPYGDGEAARRSLAAVDALFGDGVRLPDFEPKF